MGKEINPEVEFIDTNQFLLSVMSAFAITSAYIYLRPNPNPNPNPEAGFGADSN